MRHAPRMLAWGAGGLAFGAGCALVGAAWLYPDSVMALWALAAFCR